jgi:putative membrane protein
MFLMKQLTIPAFFSILDSSIECGELMYAIISLALNTIAVFVTANILPGVSIANIWVALVVAIVLGIVNTFIRPVLLVLTLPINIITLGLFTLVIMGGIVMLVSAIVPGFHVSGFFWAIAFSVVLALINSFLQTY